MKKKESSPGIIKGKLLTLSKRLKLKKLRKQTRKINYFDDCDTLPAWRFFKVLETEDIRYLLDVKRLPEYFEPLLEPVWEKIVAQYDKMNGDYVFRNSYRDKAEDIQDLNTLIILKACFELISLGSKKALPTLKEMFGISIDEITVESIRKVRSRYMLLKTQMEIKSIQKKGEKKSDDNSYVKAVISISNILNRNINPNEITVTEWVYLNKSCREIVKAKSNG